MGRLISISGIDSSGKSTQINNIYNSFSKKHKIKVLWSRVGYTPLMNFMKKIIRLFAPKSIPKPGESKKRERVFSKNWVQVLWINLAIIDLIFYYCIFFRILTLFRYVVIADRYIWDSYIDLKIKFSNFNVDRMLLWRILVFLHTKPNPSIILSIPLDESLSRSIIKNEPFSENKEERKIRLNFYNIEFSNNRWDYIVDGMDSEINVWTEIKNRIK